MIDLDDRVPNARLPLAQVLQRPWGDAGGLSEDYALVSWANPRADLGRPERLRSSQSTTTFVWVNDDRRDAPDRAGFYISESAFDEDAAGADHWLPASAEQRRLAARGDDERLEQLLGHVVIPWAAPATAPATQLVLDSWRPVIRGDTTGPVTLSGTMGHLPSGATPMLTVSPNGQQGTDRQEEALVLQADGSWRSSDLSTLPEGLYTLSVSLTGQGLDAPDVAVLRHAEDSAHSTLSLVVDRSAPVIELLSPLPARTGAPLLVLSLGVHDEHPGAVEQLQLTDLDGNVLDEVSNPAARVSLRWPLTGDEPEHMATLRAKDTAGNWSQPRQLSVLADRSQLAVTSVAATGPFHWLSEGQQAWVGTGKVSFELTTNKALHPGSAVGGRQNGLPFPVTSVIGDDRSLTVSFDGGDVPVDDWTTLTIDLIDASTGAPLSRELLLRRDDTGPVFTDKSELFYSPNNRWQYPGEVHDAGSGVASIWLEDKTGERLDDVVQDQQMLPPTWTPGSAKRFGGRTSSQSATLVALDRLGNQPGCPSR